MSQSRAECFPWHEVLRQKAQQRGCAGINTAQGPFGVSRRAVVAGSKRAPSPSKCLTFVLRACFPRLRVVVRLRTRKEASKQSARCYAPHFAAYSPSSCMARHQWPVAAPPAALMKPAPSPMHARRHAKYARNQSTLGPWPASSHSGMRTCKFRCKARLKTRHNLCVQLSRQAEDTVGSNECSEGT